MTAGPDLPVASQNKNQKFIVDNLLRKFGVTTPNNISKAHRIVCKPSSAPAVEKRGIIFKLFRRDLVQVIFNACKRTKPYFYMNSSLTPTRNRVLQVLCYLEKTLSGILESFRALNGDVAIASLRSSLKPILQVPQRRMETEQIVKL